MDINSKCLKGYAAFYIHNYLSTIPVIETRSLEVILNILSQNERRILVQFIIKQVESCVCKNKIDEDEKNVFKTTSRKSKNNKSINTFYTKKEFDDIKKEIVNEIIDPGGLSYKVEEQLKNIKIRRSIFGEMRRLISKHIPYKDRSSPFNKKLDEIAKYFMLGEIERSIVAYYYTHENIVEFYNLFSNSKDFRKNTILISRVIGYKPNEIRSTIKKQKLFGMFVFERTSDVWYRAPHIDLDPSVCDYLSSVTKESFSDHLFKEYKGDVLPLDKHIISREEKETLLYLLSNKNAGLNILFYGEPGTGKTELVKSLGVSSEKKVYFISELNDEDNKNVGKRLAALEACQNLVDPGKSIIVVDEADSILNTLFSYVMRGENVEKGAVNKLLEQSRHKIIWITNRTNLIEDSILRRFSFSIEFRGLIKKQRISIWENVLEKKKLGHFFTRHEVNDFASKYEVNAGAISLMFENIKSKDLRENKQDVIEKMNTILDKHEKLLIGEVKKNRINSVDYSLEGLNLSKDPQSLLDKIDRFYSSSNKVFKNFNLLFHGVPGSGKTEFVKHIARELNRELIVKNASDLISCWVGETEKNIREAFREAEMSHAVLFLDEADSFFIARESAERSWQVTQTNELLYQMENFQGVLICCTNFVDNLDQASFRRFADIVKFDYLKNEGKLMLFNRILAPLCEGEGEGESGVEKVLTHEQVKQLYRINRLTPGDFKVAYQQSYLLDKSKLNYQEMIDKLLKTSVNRPGTRKALGISIN